ncbi:MAG: M3 family oligoendopeptidase [Erysipelotrichaceae bacterium]
MKFSEFKYERINYQEIEKKLTELLDKLEKQTKADDFIKVFQEIEKINSHVSTMASLATVRHSINTKDEFYDKENDFWDEVEPKLQVFSHRMAEICLAFENKEELYHYIPKIFFKKAEFDLKSFDEKIIPLLIEENKLVSEYGKLKASAQIDFDGKIYNLSSISVFLQDDDRQTRKRAYNARMKFYQDNEKKFDQIYDKLVKVRTQMAKELGYDTFTELGYLRMHRFDYNRDMVAIFRQQILNHLVPLNSELYQRQAKRLGLKKLDYYDFPYHFSTGNPTPKKDPDDLVEAAVNMYHQMHEKTGEFIDVMKNQQLWDLLSKDGKSIGGYCQSFSEYKVPFIFANFNGTSHDVDVLTHEAGHAFQYYMSRDISVEECKWPTMEACEIHSMSMEFFTYPWMEDFFGEDTEKYYYSHLTGALDFLPYGVLVDHFQHVIYDNPDLSAEDRKTVWRKLEKMYIPEKEYTGCDILEKGGYWFQQGHIFQAPFYYIDYTLAQICALQFWARTTKKDDKAFDDYLHLCTLGGTLTFTDIVKDAGLIIPFEDGCVDFVVKQAREYLNTIDDTKL